MYIEKNIIDIVNYLIKKYDTNNPEELIKNMKNVDFAYVPLTKNINGLYLYISEKKQIVRVDTNLNPIFKQYTLFHEVGHCILKHRGEILLDCLSTTNKRKEEYEADLFATYFFKLCNGISKENIDNLIMPHRAKDLINKFL